MRIKLLINLMFIAIFSIALTPSAIALTEEEIAEAIAACAAKTTCTECTGVCGTQNCTYSKAYTSYIYDPPTYQVCDLQCWDQNMVDATPDGEYWTVPGHEDVTCTEECWPVSYNDAINQSCITESANDILCNCDNPTDPTPTPIDGEGGGSTTPETIPDLFGFISGRVQEDNGAAFSGNFCTQATTNPLANNNFSITAGTYPGTFSTTAVGAYESIVRDGSTYTVSLDLSNQNGSTEYICSCPAAADPNNPYLCRYYGVSPDTANVNFYLQVSNLSNDSWFQVFGGNLFSRYGIASSVPATSCAADASCQAALSALPLGSSNQNFSGFAISNLANSGSIISSSSEGFDHAYLTLADRINNVNSYAVSTDINQLSYDYFYKLVEDDLHEFSNGENYEPLLSDLTGNAWWSSTETNFIKVNGNVNIDETQGFNLTSDQSLVVFVEGNLTLDDSNTGDSNHKIISVANGGFLAFFVNGNILVSADVGYELNPDVPTVPTASVANSNIEGVFIANGTLTIGNKFDIGEVPPDRKFIGAGTFVGWTGVNLDRTFDDGVFGPILNNNQAIENFIYRPDFLANWPTKLKASLSNWREVDPQLINQ